MTDVDETAAEAAPKAKAKVRLGGVYWRLWVASVISNLGDGVAFIAYPWLASAVTRDPVLLAMVAVVQRLPWLLFTLPAGVITDRVDRRKLIVSMDVLRFVLTFGVAVAVLAGQSDLPDSDAISSGSFATGPIVYLWLLYAASLLFGMAEVLRDNAAQTILPAIVEPDGLEKANGTLWSAEMVANNFVGPPLGGFLLGIGFAVPFFLDAGTFAVAAGLIFLIVGDFRPKDRGQNGERIAWRKEIGEGVRWLWSHPLLRPMAIILGLMNGLMTLGFATFVFFAQEVLEVDATTFGILGTGAAVGGVLGGIFASRVSKLLGSGPSLYLTMVAGSGTALAVAVANDWQLVWVMTLIAVFAGTLWNVITVSLRQTIIPDELLGRVNSVYRFLGWGMIPIGALLGGVIVSVTDAFTGRELALRMPWVVVGAAYLLVLLYAVPRLTTAKIEGARSEALARKAAEKTAG